MSAGPENIDQPRAGTSTFTTHQLEHEAGAIDTATDINSSQSRSTKRKRGHEEVRDSPMVRLQTPFDTPKTYRAHDALEHENNLSPRTFVSSRFQTLNIHNPEFTPTESNTWRRTKRRTSWTVPVPLPGPASSHVNELLSREATTTSSLEDVESAVEDLVTDQLSQESTSDYPSLQQTQHDIEHAMYQFSAGSQGEEIQATSAVIGAKQDSSYPLARSTPTPPNVDRQDTLTASPSKRRRRYSKDKSPDRSPLRAPTPMQNDEGPSVTAESPATSTKRRFSSPPPRRHHSDSSITSESESENSSLWWQDSEIVGHDPTDPEDDNRGVNGIGYQKTKAEQYRISERKKRQITDYRNREAREARALRAAGRGSGSGIRSNAGRDTIGKSDKAHRVILGRVVKSRSGSPIERRLDDVEPRTTTKKGVRFEKG